MQIEWNEPASPYTVPFNRSSTVGKELLYISESLLRGQIAGDQSFSKRCEDLLRTISGSSRALLTPSCTHALEIAALLLDLQAGDEVIVPSYTFVSTANPFVLRGARVVFSDIRRDTLNLDEAALPSLITSRTRAIIPVHYAGVGCEMEVILQLARDNGIVVIEDNAHGIFGKYRGKPLGSLGEMATLSFHETKNITCGEGGSLLLNDLAYEERAEILRDKGTNRAAFLRGQVEKYTWVDVGSSYVMSDVLAAFLYGQLEQWEAIQVRRKKLWDDYARHLEGWAREQGIGLPRVPEHCEQAYHLFYLLLPNGEARRRLIDHLRERGILAVFHYIPLHLSKVGREFGGRKGLCPVTEDISDRVLRLPFYNDMSSAEQAQVVDALKCFSA